MVYAFVGAACASIVCASLVGLRPEPAAANDGRSIVSLAGRWAGPATVTPAEGPTENIKCVITYFPSEDGSHVKQNLRCKGPYTSFDAATHLQIAGGEVTGRWQDNVYSLTGSVQGNLTPGGFDIMLLGQHFAAKMRVVSSPCEQSITVTTDKSTPMKEIAGTLKKC